MKKKKATHPIPIIEYDSVGGGEVDAQPTRTCAQQEQARRVWPVAAVPSPRGVPTGLSNRLCGTDRTVAGALSCGPCPAITSSTMSK
jgi:hypothetical protein